ncbi:MAG: exodeoxyribonuclease VII small subunit [Candidatus Thermoplasmatota archaeon]
MKYEEAMKRLEEIVESLEKGGLALEEALKLYEEGKSLSELCLKKLEEVEFKVHKLNELTQSS